MVSVTIVGGQVSTEAARALEQGFTAFQDQLDLATEAQEQLSKALKENHAEYSQAKDELIARLNIHLRQLMAEAKEKETILYETLKAVGQTHQNTKESIYGAGLEKASKLANQLAHQKRIYEKLEGQMEERIMHMNTRMNDMKTEFEKTTDSLLHRQKIEWSQYQRQFQHSLKEQKIAHENQVEAMQNELKTTNQRWEAILDEVTTAFETELQRLSGRMVEGGNKRQHAHAMLQTMRESQDRSNGKWDELLKETIIKNKMFADRVVEEGHKNLQVHHQKQQEKFDNLKLEHEQEIKELKTQLSRNHGIIIQTESESEANNNNVNETVEAPKHFKLIELNDSTDDDKDEEDDEDFSDFIDLIDSADDNSNVNDNDDLKEWIQELDLEDQLMETKPYLDVVQAQSNNQVGTTKGTTANNDATSTVLPIWSIALIALGGSLVFLLLIIGVYKCHQRRVRRRRQTVANAVPGDSFGVANDMNIVLTGPNTIKSPSLVKSAML